ncbi:UNVERIFIED_CONTAM: GDSL esterase/lipase [Sesamum latifolium]|uniref:GDSL esterase/lipase n=1 Tax=Sesamum latifolium TaxID=2727402 RepID=A0AAW2WLK4_9LAMI
MAVAYAITILILIASSSKSAFGCYDSIISFGDSLADTGNFLLLSPPNNQPLCGRPPYGRTFFRRPTGRFSDGRLVVDFIAESLGLPLVEPYAAWKNAAEKGGSFSKGVNFAVAGATALDATFFDKRGIHNSYTNASLGVQLDWFKQFLARIPERERRRRREGGRGRGSATMSGNKRTESGRGGNRDGKRGREEGQQQGEGAGEGNGRGFRQQRRRPMGSGGELIKLGVKTMLVPGNLQLGCIPVFLTQYMTISTEEDYDPKTGCLTWLNELSMYHNELLQKELSRIRQLHPRIAIIYADYYNATTGFYLSPHKFGFSKESVLKACCGAGGPYNYNSLTTCGILPVANCCENPWSFVSWDGVHLTEAAYKWITQGLLQGPYTHPHIKTVCPSILGNNTVGEYEY